jgi:hypothetical protein
MPRKHVIAQAYRDPGIGKVVGYRTHCPYSAPIKKGPYCSGTSTP